MHVETGQTPEERVAVIKTTGHQGIDCQDSSFISQDWQDLKIGKKILSFHAIET